MFDLETQVNRVTLSAAVNDFNAALQRILLIDANPNADDAVTDAAVAELEYSTERIVGIPARSQEQVSEKARALRARIQFDLSLSKDEIEYSHGTLRDRMALSLVADILIAAKR